MRACALKQPKPGADLSVRANCRADPICLSTLVGAQDSCSENEKSLDCLSSSLAFQGGEWYLCRGSSVEGVPRRKWTDTLEVQRKHSADATFLSLSVQGRKIKCCHWASLALVERLNVSVKRNLRWSRTQESWGEASGVTLCCVCRCWSWSCIPPPHLLALWLRESYFTSLSPSFLICKRGVKITLSQGSWKGLSKRTSIPCSPLWNSLSHTERLP